MGEYLLIESRDPFESNDVGYYCELARGLAEAGNQVTLFLVQNAVLAARPAAQAPQLRALAGSPSVPTTVRHLPPGSLTLRVSKDHLAHAYAPPTNRCRGRR